MNLAEEIALLEQSEAEAMLRGDADKLASMWSDDLLVNSTANLISGKQILLDLIRSGRLPLRIYERRTVQVAEIGEFVVATGNETSQLAIEGADDQLLCSYMNVWTKRQDGWKLSARHVGLITRKKP
jgi:ketosteroid isomerase-like protein